MDDQKVIDARNSLQFLEGHLYRSARAMDREVVQDCIETVRAAIF
jgi:hypothetical protein